VIEPSGTGTAISVVVPAFNEEASLRDTVDAIVAALPHPEMSEIVLVDDGSSDSTRALMHEIATTCRASVVVVPRDANGGLGQALASGLAATTGRIITWIPGDGEYDLRQVLAGQPLLDDNDIVLVRRTSRGQLGRNLLSSAMYALIGLLFRFDARGYCGIFVVGRERWDQLTINSQDVFFTLEVALRARHARWRIAYAPADWLQRRAGRSKVFNVRTVVRNVWELLAFRWRLLTGR
jgi:glycosyltransferase involved in cell wall biosynthesis